MPILPAVNHPFSCGAATTTFSRTFAKRAIADRNFDINATEIRRVTSFAGESSVAINKNGGTSAPHLKNVLRKSDSTYVTDFAVEVSVLGVGYFQPVTLSSLSTGVLSTPSASGVATYQAPGQCTFRAESPDGEVALKTVTASTNSPAVVDTFQSWATGSLARHCTDQIDSLIAGKTQLNLYSDYQPYSNSNTFARNSACWANGIDLSCASPWNSSNGALYAGTLVSPRHVVFCEHGFFYPPNGTTMYFSSPTGVVITRTLTGSVAVQGADIRVGILNADVDSGVTFAKVLPSQTSDYLPGLGFTSTVPVICLNQTERASISAMSGLGYLFSNIPPAAYQSYYGELILYDSGNPAFLVVNGDPVLLGVFTNGGPGTGASIAYSATAVNAAMTSLGGGYQLTTVNLSGFTNYA